MREPQNQLRDAWLRVLRVAARLPGQALNSALALGAAAWVLGPVSKTLGLPALEIDPVWYAALTPLTSTVAAGTLSTLLIEIAQDKPVTEEQVRNQIEAAITEIDLNRFLSDRDFQRAMAHLLRETGQLEYLIRHQEDALVLELTKRTEHYDLLFNDLRSDILRIADGLHGVATRDQSTEILIRLDHLTRMLEKRGPSHQTWSTQTSLTREARQIPNPERQLDSKIEGSSPYIDIRYLPHFFHWDQDFALSLRMFGAADEFFPASVVHTTPHPDTPYELPDDLLFLRKEIIRRLTESAEQSGAMFFDGPNTRLINYRVTPIDSTEQKHVYLDLGPVGWHDYSVTKWAIDQHITHRTIEETARFVDLDQVANERTISSNRLTNILCTATTILTSDRFLLYSQRGTRVSSLPGKLTSCVAENIHQDKDGSLALTPAGGLPPAFRTVIRGIDEEVSPKLASHVLQNPGSVLLLGMDFDLVSLQPDLLFMVYLPMTFAKIQEVCSKFPGKDFIEGQIGGISISEAKQGASDLLSKEYWIPGGKASFIRSCEFLDSLGCLESTASIVSTFDELQRHNH